MHLRHSSFQNVDGEDASGGIGKSRSATMSGENVSAAASTSSVIIAIQAADSMRAGTATSINSTPSGVNSTSSSKLGIPSLIPQLLPQQQQQLHQQQNGISHGAQLQSLLFGNLLNEPFSTLKDVASGSSSSSLGGVALTTTATSSLLLSSSTQMQNVLGNNTSVSFAAEPSGFATAARNVNVLTQFKIPAQQQHPQQPLQPQQPLSQQQHFQQSVGSLVLTPQSVTTATGIILTKSLSTSQ